MPARHIERGQHCGGVAAATTESSAVGDIFMELDFCSARMLRCFEKYFGGAPGQIARVGLKVGIAAGQLNLGFDIVESGDWVAGENAQVKVDFGRGADLHMS